MSSSYDRARSPVRRSDSDRRGEDKYNRSYNRRDNRRYDSRRDHEEIDRSKRNEEDDRRRQDRRDQDRRREDSRRAETVVPDEDIQMEVPTLKKKVPISIEELIQKKEQEKKLTEKVTDTPFVYTLVVYRYSAAFLFDICTAAQVFN